LKTTLVCALWLLSSLAAGTVVAQPLPPNAAGVTMGHLHLNSRDVEANRKVLVALGGNAMRAGDFAVVRFSGVVAYLHLREGNPPSAGGTVGTMVNHVGFAVPDVKEAVARWKAAGLTVEIGARPDQAVVTTADGLRIEIVEDKSQPLPIRHDHVQLHVPGAVIPAMQAWYAAQFGAKAGTRGERATAEIPGASLVFAKVDQPAISTKGRVLDHIGFDVKNLEAYLKTLEAAGAKIDRPYTKSPTGGALAFIYDPWGTYIELNERPNPQ
jgi:catechol 2,3-dioxygenase-like lactoylglutathione lyase family enzyme